MSTNELEITLPLCHMVVTCQILFSSRFDKIEQKTGIKANNIGKLIKDIIEEVRYNNFHAVLACMSTINRQAQSTRVIDSIELSGNIRKAMLVHNNL